MPLREGEVFFLGTAIAIAPKNPTISGAPRQIRENACGSRAYRGWAQHWLVLSGPEAHAGIVARHQAHPAHMDSGDPAHPWTGLARVALGGVRQHGRQHGGLGG